MPRQEKPDMCCDWSKMHKMMGCKVMWLGVILFLIGLIRYYGYDWNVVLMSVGIVLFLKGVILKCKKMK